jgi:serine/threonine protein phosphatase PrpC
VIAVPEVRAFKIHRNTDFILLASDGIFDKLKNEDIVQFMWTQHGTDNIQNRLSTGIEKILMEAFNRKASDNVTVLAVAFKNFKAEAKVSQIPFSPFN